MWWVNVSMSVRESKTFHFTHRHTLRLHDGWVALEDWLRLPVSLVKKRPQCIRGLKTLFTVEKDKWPGKYKIICIEINVFLLHIYYTDNSADSINVIFVVCICKSFWIWMHLFVTYSFHNVNPPSRGYRYKLRWCGHIRLHSHTHTLGYSRLHTGPPDTLTQSIIGNADSGHKNRTYISGNDVCTMAVLRIKY